MPPKRIQGPLEAKRMALTLARVERAAALGRWRVEQGVGDPRRRLAWLLDFAYGPDPAQMPPAELPGLRYALSLLVHDATGGRWTVLPAERPVSSTELQAAQREVRTALEALVGGRQYSRRLSTAPHRCARLGPATIPSPPIPPRRFVVVNLLLAALPDAVLQAALELLSRIPPIVVRQCTPDQRFKITCGRIFIGKRRQKYCAMHGVAVRHAQVQAALGRFRKKPGKRKKTTAQRKGWLPR
jgi:hypothetical protein